ncbi:MAG: hypothetical protein GX862_04490, partial [Leucobacter sp.]|nr:hypothetical protein [Leucobacter sp.]
MPNDTLISVARWAARRLPMRHTIWLKRLRCEELPWQRRQRRLRALSTSSIEETFRHRANLYTRILQGYDAEAAVKHNTERVRDALHSHQIEHVVLPRITPFRPILAIHDRDTRATLRALEARREAEGWTILVKKNEAKQHVLRIEVTR